MVMAVSVSAVMTSDGVLSGFAALPFLSVTMTFLISALDG
jgi:hypothetical protein